MKIKANEAPQIRGELGDMARGAEAGGQVMTLMSLADGTDFCHLLKGLPHDHCQCPHWGYLLKGKIIVDYQDGKSETVEAGDLYYWPPGHTIRVEGETQYVEFSPAKEMGELLDHVIGNMSA